MEITFQNKEDSNRIQRDGFLSLSTKNRFYAWLNLMYHSKKFQTNEMEENDNYLIIINCKSA